MSSLLNKSLDDILKQSKNSKNRNNAQPNKNRLSKTKNRINNRGKNSILSRVGTQPSVLVRLGAQTNSNSNSNSSRPSPKTKRRPTPKSSTLKRSPPNSSLPKNAPSANISIKGEAGPAAIFVANLDPDASTDDVKTCFKKFGEINSCTLLFDSAGNPTGNAEIVYRSKPSAINAIATLNNVIADGRTLIVQPKGQFTVPISPSAHTPSAHSAPRSSNRRSPPRSHYSNSHSYSHSNSHSRPRVRNQNSMDVDR
ncbi:THO complex subunit 4C [Smittium culicis]|uniref:THO complex subunit 4C n=1 Tax=Smittium culicis TaxID=133412 RepID=A0A1R1YQD0_9FUNG|nr:THO complex subunit 4C [Smittium culicis]OMJ29097.1 THO complex subunit 4C [Smittium culicis]